MNNLEIDDETLKIIREKIEPKLPEIKAEMEKIINNPKTKKEIERNARLLQPNILELLEPFTI